MLTIEQVEELASRAGVTLESWQRQVVVGALSGSVDMVGAPVRGRRFAGDLLALSTAALGDRAGVPHRDELSAQSTLRRLRAHRLAVFCGAIHRSSDDPRVVLIEPPPKNICADV